jgi:hypothetical protein
MPPHCRRFAVAALVLAAAVSAAAVEPRLLPAPVHLRVEGLQEQPIIVTSEANPHFSFLHGQLPTPSRGVVQVSYRLTVSERVPDGATDAATLWDTGDVASANCSEIEYAGLALSAFTRYSWTVEWTAGGALQGRSAPATGHFETGPMEVGDWGKDIAWFSRTTSTRNQLRLPFELPPAGSGAAGSGAAGGVEWARAYVAAAGCHHLEINGQVPAPDLRGICPWPVGLADGGHAQEGVSAPAANQWKVRYQTHDVTSLLQPGMNALGLLAGHVMVGNPNVMLLLVVQPKGSGSPLTFSTGGTAGWLERESFVVADSAWATTIDWSMFEAGWSTPGFKASLTEWQLANATAIKPGQLHRPLALAMPLTTVVEEVEPESVSQLSDGSYMYKFPKNFVGTVRLAALPTAEAGSNISVLTGEWLADTAPTSGTMQSPSSPPERCGMTTENKGLKLGGCKGSSVIDKVVFASWGTPIGDCAHGLFTDSNCSAPESFSVVEAACIGKSNCTVMGNSTDMPDPCVGIHKWFAARVHCSSDPPPPPPPPRPPPPPIGPFPTISGSKAQYENHLNLQPGSTKDIETLFCWHGFTWVRVLTEGHTGFKGELASIVGLAIHTNVSQTGVLHFGGDGVSGSNTEEAAVLLNGINSMTLQSQRTNVAA